MKKNTSDKICVAWRVFRRAFGLANVPPGSSFFASVAASTNIEMGQRRL